jgi:membrane protease YdiL (CAAX protease family)
MLPQKKIPLFLLLTFSLSTLAYIPIIWIGAQSEESVPYVLILMFSPGLAAILTRLITTRSLRGMGWRLGPARWLGIAYILPVLYALPVYAFTWLSGLGRLLNPYDFSALVRQYSPSSSLVTAVLVYFLIKATKGVVENMIFSVGEEIGWRGFLVPELAKTTSFTKTAFISGIVWAVWHMPGIFLAGYNSGNTPTVYAAAMFAVLIIAISFPFTWLTLKSKSLWPAILLHTTHNIFIQGYFDRLTGNGSITPYIIGEFGVGLALTCLVVAYVFWRMQWNKSLETQPGQTQPVVQPE